MVLNGANTAIGLGNHEHPEHQLLVRIANRGVGMEKNNNEPNKTLPSSWNRRWYNLGIDLHCLLLNASISYDITRKTFRVCMAKCFSVFHNNGYSHFMPTIFT